MTVSEANLTCLVVVQGPGTQPLPTEALALHVVIDVYGVSPLLLYLLEVRKMALPQSQPSPKAQTKLGSRARASSTRGPCRASSCCCLVHLQHGSHLKVAHKGAPGIYHQPHTGTGTHDLQHSMLPRKMSRLTGRLLAYHAQGLGFYHACHKPKQN